LNKESLHLKLAQVSIQAEESTVITEEDFIEVYGNNESRKIGKTETSRPELLANIYHLNVIHENQSYTFTSNQ